MKILLVKAYPKLTFVAYLAKGLKNMGHEVHVAIPGNHLDAKKMRDLGIKVHVINFLRMTKIDARKRFMDTSVFKRITSFLKSNSFDVINLNLPPGRLLWGTAAIFSKEAAITSSIQGFEGGYVKASNYFNNTSIAVSSAVKRFLISKGVSANKIWVIHNGIDIGEMDTIKENKFYLHKELGLDPGIRLVGMVAYFYNRTDKGHKYFLDAAKIVLSRFPDTRFVLIGSDALSKGNKEYFESYARKLGLRGKVYFLGERSDVAAIMSSLYLVALPSLSEGCPMSLLEAMARKVPIVASDIESIKEVVLDGKTGILFKPGNAKALARFVSFLLGHPEKAKRLGLAGRLRVERYFRMENIAGKYDSLFRRLLARKRRIV